MWTRKSRGPAPWTQCAAVRTRSGAISDPLQNAPPSSSEANHGAFWAGVPWKIAAEARTAAASICRPYEVSYATIRDVSPLTRRGLIGAGLAGGALLGASRAAGHSAGMHDHGGHAN